VSEVSLRHWRTISISSKPASSRSSDPGRHDRNKTSEAFTVSRIVAEADLRLSLIRAVEAQVAANLARVQRLRQAILRRAFAAPVEALEQTAEM